MDFVFGFVVCAAVGVSFDIGFASTWVGYVVYILVVVVVVVILVVVVVMVEHGLVAVRERERKRTFNCMLKEVIKKILKNEYYIEINL